MHGQGKAESFQENLRNLGEDFAVASVCRTDETLGLTETTQDVLEDTRLGSKKQHGLVPLLRQSIYSRSTADWQGTKTSMTPSGCALTPPCDTLWAAGSASRKTDENNSAPLFLAHLSVLPPEADPADRHPRGRRCLFSQDAPARGSDDPQASTTAHPLRSRSPGRCPRRRYHT